MRTNYGTYILAILPIYFYILRYSIIPFAIKICTLLDPKKQILEFLDETPGNSGSSINLPREPLCMKA